MMERFIKCFNFLYNTMGKENLEASVQRKDPERELFWEPFVNKEVSINYQGDIYTGKFNMPNLDEGFVDLLPHIQSLGNNNGAYIERETPVRIPLSIFNNNLVIIRPFYEGFMEEKVGEINKKSNGYRRSISFHNE